MARADGRRGRAAAASGGLVDRAAAERTDDRGRVEHTNQVAQTDEAAGFQRVDVEDVANALKRAHQQPPAARGRAVFLIGAGCSVSAGIPAASGTAKHAAVWLARVYSARSKPFRLRLAPDHTPAQLDRTANAAVRRLEEDGVLRDGDVPRDDGGEVRWSELYNHLFERHIVSPNEQRTFISYLLGLAQGPEGQVRLNWAHACLGELVGLGFVHTVLTTNFDQLALSAIIRSAGLPVVADGSSSYNRILPQPPIPQLVHLHGSMHTYELRNTKRSIEGAEERPAYSMIHHLLQQCQVLVVVGHSGTDAGVMSMLLREAQEMTGIVVYWVVHSMEAELHANVRQLLRLENKFLVDGGEADKFFGDLMRRLDVSQPKWVADPIGELERQRHLLVPPADNTEVLLLTEEYERKLAEVIAYGRDKGPETNPRLVSAARRAQGDYQGARDALKGVDLETDVVAARLSGLTALDLYRASPAKHRAKLQEALNTFRSLVERTLGRERFSNLEHLLEALLDFNDALNQRNAASRNDNAVDEIIKVTNRHMDDYKRDPSSYAVLLKARADARQQKADPVDDATLMQAALKDYRTAAQILEEIEDTYDLLPEVREGMAGALQVLGSREEPDLGMLDEAIRLFELLASRPSLNDNPSQVGGLAYNLGNAWAQLWISARGARGDDPRRQAVEHLTRAQRAFEESGETERLDQAKARLQQLRSDPPQRD